MLKKLFLGSAFLLLGVVAAQASELAISFSNKTAQLALQQQITDYDNGRSIFEVRGLYDDEEDTALVSASFDVLGPIAQTGLEIGAGIRGYYVNSGSEDDEIGAGALGAIIRFVPPALPKASLRASIYYSPEVFTIMDGENLWDAEVSAAFEIAPRATVFATFTKIEAEFVDLNDRILDRTVRIGLALGF